MDTNLQKYMAFLKTVEYGSFTKAAEVLHYSQSGISRMISDLEKEWNLSVLERGRSGVRLTSDGVKMLPFVQNVCREYQNLQDQVDQLQGLESGLIRIGTISSIATHWLPSVIKAFQKDYPNIEYELLSGDYGEIEEWLLAGRVDCGFLLLPASAELEITPLKRDEMMVIMPQNHPLADCESFPIKALEEEPFMLLERGEKSQVSELLRQRGLHPKVRFITLDDYAIMSMVESGLGISILPNLILQRTPYHIVKKSLEEPAYRDLGLAMRDSKSASAAVKRFLTYVLKETNHGIIERLI